MRSSPAPSIRADSSSSSGMPRANWRTRKMPNTLAIAGTTRAAVGVDEAQGLEHQEERQHRHLARDHERAEEEAEQAVAAAKRSLAKA
jgi:nitrate reductase alpha subunit